VCGSVRIVPVPYYLAAVYVIFVGLRFWELIINYAPIPGLALRVLRVRWQLSFSSGLTRAVFRRGAAFGATRAVLSRRHATLTAGRTSTTHHPYAPVTLSLS
jgi:hypothetical protein